MYKVERVIHPTTWIRELKIGEIRIAIVSLKQKHSFRNLISKYNQSQGLLAGKFIHSTYNNRGERIAVYAITLEEREKEINHEADENKWKRRLPQDFNSSRMWPEGTEHE
ncbi:hypothetical protein [Hoylesella buccalis]|jgi:hypothetical protein|uniref:hypothetical protein n=1 Tax=Hoylesella buccalis TaxID=28127 RepID=UPI000308148A|nr:hypothetical protein [Hoylesella buccalis]